MGRLQEIQYLADYEAKKDQQIPKGLDGVP